MMKGWLPHINEWGLDMFISIYLIVGRLVRRQEIDPLKASSFAF